MFKRIKASLQRHFGIYTEELEMFSLASNFKRDYGYSNSVREQKPVDSYGNPIPWFTYPAIEFLESLALENTTVFEWGSGNSSLFFAERCLSIKSIESDKSWYEYQLTRLKPNQQIIFADKGSNEYPSAIKTNPSSRYNIIIVDGVQRVECTFHAISMLKKGGLIILDNSDWYPTLSQSLRQNNFIQIDFCGHGPINPYTWTTSFFFDGCNQNALDSIFGRKKNLAFYSKSGLVQVASDDRPLNLKSKNEL